MKAVLSFLAFVAAAILLNIWPALNYQAAGGNINILNADDAAMSGALEKPGLIYFATLMCGGILVMFGLVWNLLHSWKPFALAVLGTVIVSGLLGAYHFVLSPDSALTLGLFILSLMLGFGTILFSVFLSLRNNILLVTLIRLIEATVFSALVTLLFPFIVIGIALYLKFTRGMKFTEIWSESPELYNFFIVNIFPIFFHILPGLRYVQAQGKMEKKRFKKEPEPQFECRLDLAKLKVGDVILTGQESWNHAVPIQASNILSNGEDFRYWSHAAIYAGDGKVIEAQSDGRGVTETVVADYFFKKGHRLSVLRHRYLPQETLDQVVAYCREKEQSGCAYDTWGVTFYALASLVPPMLSSWLEKPFAEKFFNVSDAYFCSELVAEAFAQNGYDLFDRKPWRVKPLDFAFNPLFHEIECDYERWPVNPPQAA